MHITPSFACVILMSWLAPATAAQASGDGFWSGILTAFPQKPGLRPARARDGEVPPAREL